MRLSTVDQKASRVFPVLRTSSSLFLIVLLTACSSQENEANLYVETDGSSVAANGASVRQAPVVSAPPEPDDNNVTKRGCFDITAAQPRSLIGVLNYSIFPGPPNYEDVQTGDTPEPTYTLRLDRDVCISDGEEGFADPSEFFDRVHLVQQPGKSMGLRSLVGKRVKVAINDRLAAHTGHHHAPLVAWIEEIREVKKSDRRELDDDDPTAEYGTAATTIRAFYSALNSGQGELAANFVIPEKRTTGPFAPANLTKFYGNMREPITLLELKPISEISYQARYRYAATKSVCTGRAMVKTTVIDGRNYIARIKALDGC